MKPGFVAKASRTVNGLENTVDQAWLDFQQALDHHTEIAHKAMRRLVGRLPAKLASDDKGNFVPTGQIHVSKSFYRQLDAIYDQWHDAVLRDLDIPKWDRSKASWTKSLGLLPHKGGRFLLQMRDRILRTVRTLAHQHVMHTHAVAESQQVSEHDVLLDVKAIIAESELREFNIYHDPHTGEFTSGGGFSAATAEKPVKFKKMSVKGATYLMKYKNPASAVYAKDFGVEPDEAVAHAKAILAGEVEPDTIVPGKATLAAGVLPPHLAAKVSGDAGGADKLPGADEPEGEEPTIDELPPSKLGEPKAYKADDFKVINAHPGGSTGAKIVEDQATGEKFVMKQGTSPEHLENEAVANQAYRAAGINAPDSRMVTVDGKPALLSPYLDDSQTLNDSLNMVDGHSEKEGLLKQAREGFMADAALGNWDAAGANLDNIIYDNKSGKMFRIDNGGSLMYRAQGRMKSASQFKANVPEIGTMLDPSKNPPAAKVFGGITPEEAKQQVADLANNREKILAAIPDKKVRDIVGQHIDWLKNAANEPTAPHSSFTGRDAFGNQWQYGKLVTPESGSGATAKIAMKDAAHPDFATPGKYHYQTHVQLPPGGAEAASTKEAKDAVAKGIPWSDDRYGHVLTAKGQLMYGAAGEKYAKQELLAKGISSKDADKQVAAISKYTGGSYLDLNYHLGNHVATEKELEQVDRVRDYFANSTPMASEKPLTRGTVLAKATMDSLQEDFQNGVTWQTPVVSSFTTGRPKPIGGGKGIKDGVKVDIHVAPGHDAFRPIAHFSQHPESEMEVLALPGTRFKVLKIEKKGSGYDMWVKQHNYKPKVSESISKEEAKKWRIAKQGEEIESEFRDEDGNLIWKAPDPSKQELEERWNQILESVVGFSFSEGDTDQPRDEHGRWTTVDADEQGQFPKQPYHEQPVVPEKTIDSLTRTEPLLRDKLKQKSIERSYAYDQKGNILFTAIGDAHSVANSQASMKKIEGGVFTHSHPSGSSFSDNDLKTARKYKLAEFRAVTKDGTFVIGPPKDGWGSISRDKFDSDVDEAFKIRSGYANANVTAIVKRYKLHYRFDPIAKKESLDEAIVPRFKFKFDSKALGKNKIVRPIAGLKVHTPMSAKTGKAVSLKPISKQAHAILKKAEATSAITQQEKGWLENVLRGMDGLARSHANEVYDVATSGPTRQQLLAAVDKFSKGKISKRQLKLSVQTHARAMVRRIVGSDAFKAGTKPPQAFLQIPDTRSGAVANKSTVERAFTIVDRDAHLDAAGGKADSLGLWPGDSIQALPIPEGLDVEDEAAAEREKYLKRIQDGFLMPYEEDSE